MQVSRVTPSAPASPDPAPLRVLLIDDGAHRVALIRDELTQQGHEVVAVIDSAIVVHECVTRLKPDVVIIDSESPSRDTLEQVATLSARNPRPVVAFAEDDSDEPLQRAMQAGVGAYVVAGLQPHRLASVLKVAIARFEQDKSLRQQLVQAEAQLSSRRALERAKAILMRQGGGSAKTRPTSSCASWRWTAARSWCNWPNASSTRTSCCTAEPRQPIAALHQCDARGVRSWSAMRRVPRENAGTRRA